MVAISNRPGVQPRALTQAQDAQQQRQAQQPSTAQAAATALMQTASSLGNSAWRAFQGAVSNPIATATTLAAAYGVGQAHAAPVGNSSVDIRALQARQAGGGRIWLHNTLDVPVTYGKLVPFTRFADSPLGTIGAHESAFHQLPGGAQSPAFWAEKPGESVPSHTLAEFSFDPVPPFDPEGRGYAMTFADVSNVDGHNLPMTVRPIGHDECAAEGPMTCPSTEILPNCPPQNRVEQNGRTIGCSKIGDVENPANPAAVLFKEKCPDAYAFSSDDKVSKGCYSKDYEVIIGTGDAQHPL